MSTTDPGLRRLALCTVLAAFPGTTPPPWAEQLLHQGLAGYTLFAGNVTDPAQLAALTAALRTARPDVLVAIDEEGGDVTRLAHTTGSPYPGNAALGVAGDPALTRRVYRAIGAELAAAGVNLDFAPVVDVNVADDNPIIGTRAFGADPATVAAHSAAAVTGLQETGVAACAKHFPGHGATLADSHLTLPTVDVPVDTLRRRELPPFTAAIEAGVRAVMTAHIRVPELTGDHPATLSRASLTTLLRQECGFPGVAVTDALEMAGAAETTGGVPAAAVAALAAGADLLCLGADVDAPLVHRVADEITAAVGDGRLPVTRLDQAAARVADLAARTTAARTTRAPGGPAGPDRALGLEAASRAVRVDGDLTGLTGLFPVQLATPGNPAEGGPRRGLAGVVPDLLIVGAEETSADQLRRLAGSRPLLLAGRHLHRTPATRALVEQVCLAHPTVVVELGWPAGWRPPAARAVVTTHSASHATATALLDLFDLLDHPPG